MPEIQWIARIARPRRRTAADLSRGRRAGKGTDSVRAEIAVDFPGRDVADVVEPLLPLRLDEIAEDVLAERLAHQVVLLELVERFLQISGQLVDPEMPPLAVAHLVDVLVHRRSRIDLPL